MQDAHEPFDAEQPVERRRRIDPSERQLRCNVDAVVLYRGHGLPFRATADGRRKCGIDGHDDIGLPQEHLLERDVDEIAGKARRRLGDVARARELQHFGLQRAARSRRKAVGTASVEDPRPLRFGNRRDPRCDRGERCVDVSR
jgi:hypothetical protein